MKGIKMGRFVASLCAFITVPPLELSEHKPLCGREAGGDHFRDHMSKNSTFLERSTLLVHISI